PEAFQTASSSALSRSARNSRTRASPAASSTTSAAGTGVPARTRSVTSRRASSRASSRLPATSRSVATSSKRRKVPSQVQSMLKRPCSSVRATRRSRRWSGEKRRQSNRGVAASSTTSTPRIGRPDAAATVPSKRTVAPSACGKRQGWPTPAAGAAARPASSVSAAQASAIVRERERDIDVERTQERDDLLQVVLVLAGDAHGVSLDGALDLEFALLDRGDELLRSLRRDALLESQLHPRPPAGGRLDLARPQRLQVDAALDEFGLEHLERLIERVLVGRLDDDLLTLQLQRGVDPLEVVAGHDLLVGLREGVADLLEVHLRNDVE